MNTNRYYERDGHVVVLCGDCAKSDDAAHDDALRPCADCGRAPLAEMRERREQIKRRSWRTMVRETEAPSSNSVRTPVSA